jgi:hypothetical protein
MHCRRLEEDIESFFIAFEQFCTKLETEWKQRSKSMANDAYILFDGMDKMLTETANAEWHDVLAQTVRRDWETYKRVTAEYITTKVLPNDAYDLQVTYLQEQGKPKKLLSKQWYLCM